MSQEGETIRVLVKNEYDSIGKGTSFSAKSVQGAPKTGDDKITVLGYAEVKKGFSFERRYSEEEFIDYLQDHAAVKYLKWFEDRLDTEVEN